MVQGMKLGIVNTKGGVGKTTTTVFLAAAAHAQGLTVEVQDLDKQASSTKWLDPLLPLDRLTVTVANSYSVKRRSAADVTIIDTAPGDPHDVEIVAETCDFVIVPSTPGEINDDRTRQTVAYLETKNTPHAVVLVQADPRTKATRESRDKLLNRTAVFDTEIPHREMIRNAYGTWPTDLYGYDALLVEIQTEARTK
jgi:chromosome partitioning protein